MDIEFKDGAVCFAGGCRWYLHDGVSGVLFNNIGAYHSFDELLSASDFQLNSIKQGYYIEASELDTEQKYNDAVEVFGLFGFEVWDRNSGFLCVKKFRGLAVNSDGDVLNADESCIRKITFNQLMAIGALKRLGIESDKKNQVDMLSMESIEPIKQEVRMQKNKPVVAQVMVDLTERMEIGIKTYGEALRANNGRDALQDAYEEALDLACYLKQAMIEREITNYEEALKGNGG